jgi:hypothetical protein
MPTLRAVNFVGLGVYAPKPIPDTPTHCRGCGSVLEPLRRWGGLCRTCIAPAEPGKLRDPQVVAWTIVKEFKRKRKGVTEWCVRVQCGCGRQRVIAKAAWRTQRSTCCKRCSLARFSVTELGRSYA